VSKICCIIFNTTQAVKHSRTHYSLEHSHQAGKSIIGHSDHGWREGRVRHLEPPPLASYALVYHEMKNHLKQQMTFKILNQVMADNRLNVHHRRLEDRTYADVKRLYGDVTSTLAGYLAGIRPASPEFTRLCTAVADH